MTQKIKIAGVHIINSIINSSTSTAFTVKQLYPFPTNPQLFYFYKNPCQSAKSVSKKISEVSVFSVAKKILNFY